MMSNKIKECAMLARAILVQRKAEKKFMTLRNNYEMCVCVWKLVL